MSSQTKTVLITGGSSGIGFDVARAFLGKGSNVVINGRNADKLQAAAEKLDNPEKVAIVPGDIGSPKTGEARCLHLFASTPPIPATVRSQT